MGHLAALKYSIGWTELFFSSEFFFIIILWTADDNKNVNIDLLAVRLHPYGMFQFRFSARLTAYSSFVIWCVVITLNWLILETKWNKTIIIINHLLWGWVEWNWISIFISISQCEGMKIVGKIFVVIKIRFNWTYANGCVAIESIETSNIFYSSYQLHRRIEWSAPTSMLSILIMPVSLSILHIRFDGFWCVDDMFECSRQCWLGTLCIVIATFWPF